MSIQPDTPSRPSGMYLVVAVLVLLAGVGIFAYMSFSGAKGAFSTMQNLGELPTLVAPGEVKVPVREPDTYIVAHQTEAIGSRPGFDPGDITDIKVVITSPSSETVELQPLGAEFKGQLGDKSGEAMGQFVAKETGDYTVTASYPDEADDRSATLIILPRGIFLAFFKAGGSILTGAGICCASGVIALILVIVFFVKRSKASRAAPMYPPPGMPPPGGAPPAH